MAEKIIGILTCPKCGHKQKDEIPGEKCVPFYKCEGCNELISAKPPSCCVFCSYGDRTCPVSHEMET